MDSLRSPIPVTVVTGFLGSGKTTLVNQILRAQHGHRIAVIENEFGEVPVDGQILLRDNDALIVETANGCMCCSIRGDLVTALDIRGFELRATREFAQPRAEESGHGHHVDVSSFAYRTASALDREKLESFLSVLIERYGFDMLRYKGVLDIAGCDERVIFQGVHAMFGSEPGAPWREGEKRQSVLVFIGRDLPAAVFLEGLARCGAESSEDPASVLRAAA